MAKYLISPVLRSFSNKEVRHFRLFLESPYHNKRPEVKVLFEHLIRFIQEGNELPEKEELYALIMAKASPFNDQQLRLWLSYLMKCCESFLLLQDQEKEGPQRQNRLVRIYRKRNIEKLYQREIKQAQKKLDSGQRNADYYHNSYALQLEAYQHDIRLRRTSDLNLQRMIHTLDYRFIAEKLKQACLAISHATVYKAEYNFGLLESIFSFLSGKDWRQHPAIEVYHKGYLALSGSNNSQHFPEFKEAILRQGKAFSKEERGDLYLLAINFIIRQYNAGDPSFLADELELYQEGLEQNLFLKNGSLSRFTYRNIVTVGLVLQEYDWIERFIHEYKDQLSPEFRESMFSFSLARLEYDRKNFGEALQLLQKSEYKDLLLNLAAKTVMLKIFYELEEFDLLSAHLEAMRMFLRRKNIMGYHKTNYSNLVTYTKKLIEVNPFDKPARNRLREEMEATPALAEKGWLIEQVEGS